MGDAILGLSSVSYLKKTFPDAKITYGVPKWVFPLFMEVDTMADAFLPIELDKFTDWFLLYKAVRNEKFDCIIELNQTGRTAKFFNLFSLLKGTPYYFHNHNLPPKEGSFILDQGIKKPNIQRDLDTCYSVAKKILGASNCHAPNFIEYPPLMNLSKDSVEGFPKIEKIVLGVVATRESKMWPLDYFTRLITLIIQSNPSIKILIPLSNSYSDKNIEVKLKALGIPPQVSFIRKPLYSLPKALVGAKAYIGNDTGLKHLCVALGIKTFTFFGIEDPLEWHPYNIEKHKYFSADIPGDAYKTPQKFKDCIREIFPEEVIKDIRPTL